MVKDVPRLCLFPKTARIEADHLIIGGCDTVELARNYGTPLYLFDKFTLVDKCNQFITEFKKHYTDTLVIYACKAFINRALAFIFKQQGMGLDVVSGGELGIACSVSFPPEKIYFHGNNKGTEELKMALDWGIGRFVVDNLYELRLLNELAKERGMKQDILLRLSPGVDPHTHHYTTTGVLESKFGFPIVTGQAEAALSEAISASNLRPIGLHCHLGSPIFETAPYQETIDIMLRFAWQMKQRYGFDLKEFSPGGGFAIQYTLDSPALPTADYAEAITSKLLTKAQEQNLAPPRLVIEPGRAIVGQAGVALYTAGSTKDIPGIRRYISVDGGIADNIRPALYQAKYESLVANKAAEEEKVQFTIAGKFCESGDILIQQAPLPQVSAGDTIAIPACGAYCLSMASNYNASLKPAIILVNEGKAYLIRRRENIEDLMSHDILPTDREIE